MAHCNDLACTTATITTLDAPARVTNQRLTSLTIGADGLGLISYHDTPECCPNPRPDAKVKVAHCHNLACTSATLTTVATVPAGDEETGHASIATAANGFGIIAYHHGGTNRMLKVAACTNPDCTTKVITIVDQANPGDVAGSFASVTVGQDGLALISYTSIDNAGGHLKVAHCSNVLCTQSTRITADAGSSAWTKSITIGGDGLGVISYTDIHNNDLKVAHCTNPACSTATNKTVDAFDNVGHSPTITTGTDGLPLISYSGPGIAGPFALRVLHCGNADCTAPISKPF